MADLTYFRQFWSEDNWGFEFGEPGDVYTLGFHIGQDMLTRDSFGRGSSDIPLPALEGGTVTNTGFSYNIGRYVTIRTAGGKFHTYCHTKNGLSIGDAVEKGQVVAVSAGRADNPGAAWSGAHLHFVISTAYSTAWNPVRSQVIDPRPYIRAALTSTAGDDFTLYPEVPIDPEAENDMRVTTIFFDKGEESDGFASTAVITPSSGFVQTSIGRGDRGKLNAFVNMANAFDYPVDEKHVDAAGWAQAKVYAQSSPVDANQIAALVSAQLPTLSADKVAAIVTASLESALADDFAGVNANINEIPVGFTPIIQK